MEVLAKSPGPKAEKYRCCCCRRHYYYYNYYFYYYYHLESSGGSMGGPRENPRSLLSLKAEKFEFVKLFIREFVNLFIREDWENWG